MFHFLIKTDECTTALLLSYNMFAGWWVEGADRQQNCSHWTDHWLVQLQPYLFPPLTIFSLRPWSHSIRNTNDKLLATAINNVHIKKYEAIYLSTRANYSNVINMSPERAKTEITKKLRVHSSTKAKQVYTICVVQMKYTGKIYLSRHVKKSF